MKSHYRTETRTKKDEEKHVCGASPLPLVATRRGHAPSVRYSARPARTRTLPLSRVVSDARWRVKSARFLGSTR